MPTPPMCKLCEKRHWTYEPHKLSPNTESHLTSPNEESPKNGLQRAAPQQLVREGSGKERSEPQKPEAQTSASASTRNARWRTGHKESYNAYMKGYMKKRRSRA